MGDLIYRQNAIDAICSVCGNDCDKSEFVYNAPQDEQVIMCPEHYVLSTLPSAEPEIIRCKDCIYQTESWSGIKYCEAHGDHIGKDYDYCSNARRKDNE